MTLREATTLDAPIMAALHAGAFAAPDAWSEAVFAMQLALPNVHGMLHPGGGLILLRQAADEAEILTLAVIPASRRTGVAAALLAAGVEAVRSRGVVAVYLEVAVSNSPARRLYGKFGFAEVGRRRGYYPDGGDALVLRLLL